MVYMQPVPMRSCFSYLLDPVLSPQMDLLALGLAPDLSFHVQMLEYDSVAAGSCRIIGDGMADLAGQLFIEAPYPPPPGLGIMGSVHPLEFLQTIQFMGKTVFITRKVDELPSEDRSVRLHDGADRIRIKSQIDAQDPLVFDRCFRQFDCLRESEPEGPLASLPFQYRSGTVNSGPVSS